MEGIDKTFWADSLLVIHLNKNMKWKATMNVEENKHLEELEKRLNSLEKHGIEDSLILLEILSNITFFGKLKINKCTHAREGQCGHFFLKRDATKKIPIATKCRIKGCSDEPNHCHLELSNVTCAFCPETK